MKTVNVRVKVFYDYQVEIPDNEKNVMRYCDISDPIYFPMSKLMGTKGTQWERGLFSICDEDTGELLWNGE